MLLAWSLFNLFLALLFLYACWRVGRFLQSNVGAGTTLLFLLGLLFFACKTPQPTIGAAKNLLARTNGPTHLANGSAMAHQPLDATHDLIALAEYQQDEQGITPRGLYVTFSGFMLGHSWIPQDGMLAARNDTLHYEAFVRHDWSLLGTVLYTKMEDYTGQFPIQNQNDLP